MVLDLLTWVKNRQWIRLLININHATSCYGCLKSIPFLFSSLHKNINVSLWILRKIQPSVKLGFENYLGMGGEFVLQEPDPLPGYLCHRSMCTVCRLPWVSWSYDLWPWDRGVLCIEPGQVTAGWSKHGALAVTTAVFACLPSSLSPHPIHLLQRDGNYISKIQI